MISIGIGLLGILSIIFFLAAFVGLFVPKAVCPFGRPTRPRAFFGSLVISILALIVMGVLVGNEPPQSRQTATAPDSTVTIETNQGVITSGVPGTISSSKQPVMYLAVAGVVAAVFCLLAILMFVRYRKAKSDHNFLHEKFSGVIDAKEEQQRIEADSEKIRAEYGNKKKIYDTLSQELRIVEESLDFISFGIYEPHYDFSDSEAYKTEIKNVRGHQKEMIHSKKAAVCETEWNVGGSLAEGRKMANQGIRLMLRAFNGECDAAIAKVTWNNVDRMEARIQKAFEAINKLGKTNTIYVAQKYFQLKLKELYLVHEYREKKQREKEEQAEIRTQMREEEKARREAEKKEKEAAAEEVRAIKALEKAKTEVKSATGKQLELLQKMIVEFEAKLQEAQDAKQKAISWAQLTKQGHVYVISNIGSFGEEVYKIGLTRRLEPLDRVKELGDASVPFAFDVHAMIFSKDAPALENALHDVFGDRRVNMVNHRKEFFRVSLEEIENAVLKKCQAEEKPKISFTKVAEARDYRETHAKLKKESGDPGLNVAGGEDFPSEI